MGRTLQTINELRLENREQRDLIESQAARIAELEGVVEIVSEADRRFGQFADMHDPKADASPMILLADLARRVRKAAESARKAEQ